MHNNFVLFMKKRNYYFAFTHHLTKPHVYSIATKMAAEVKVQLKLLDVFEYFNDVDMVQYIDKLIIMKTSDSHVAAVSITVCLL